MMSMALKGGLFGLKLVATGFCLAIGFTVGALTMQKVGAVPERRLRHVA